MRSTYLLLALALTASPSWALFKCVADGKTSFQEHPCERASGQTSIKAQYAPAAFNATPDSTPRARTPQELVAIMELERLRNEAEYALRDRNVRLSNHRAQCDADVRALAANRNGWNNNLAGATRSQAEATAASAHATNCDTQARQIEAEIVELRRVCAERACRSS